MANRTKRDWQRTPNAYVWNTLGFESLCQNVSIATSTSASTVNAAAIMPLPFSCKIAKVAVAFTAVSGAASATFQIAYGIGSGSILSGVSIFTPIVGDDSFNTTASGGNLGFPTSFCYAAHNQAVMWNTATGTAADVVLNTTNFPGSTTGSGGIAIFGEAPASGNIAGIINSDVVYASGPQQGSTLNSGFCGFFIARFNTSAASTISGITISLGLEPITLTETWYTPNSPQATPISGLSNF